MRVLPTQRCPLLLHGVARGLAALLSAFFIVAAAQLALATQAHALTIAVIGDSVAHDLARGMEDLYGNNRHVRVVRQTKFATGLVRTDYYDWNAVARDFLRHHNPDLIFVVIGGNDRQALRVHGRRYSPLSKGWLREYEKRVAHFMDNIKREHARVYWVGLPPVRSDSLTHAYRIMNGIYRREAARHRFEYIDIWNELTTASGAYSSFGKSLEGVKRRIRMEDGQHFTEVGRLVFAADVAKAAGLRR